MIFIGIDQTGAVDSKGIPKPLPACALVGQNLQLVQLPSFNQASLFEGFQLQSDAQVSICADCVLGLPKELNVSLHSAIAKTLEFEGYGRAVAQRFFRILGGGKILRRQVEIECKSNSVFQEKPFQKNIQTGTFRIWKDLAHSSDWYSFPDVEVTKSKKAIPIREGYPSLAWKILFGTRHRLPEKLSSLIHEFDPRIKWTEELQDQVNRNSNFADAIVLALLLRSRMKQLDERHPSCEGWILGAEQSNVSMIN